MLIYATNNKVVLWKTTMFTQLRYLALHVTVCVLPGMSYFWCNISITKQWLSWQMWHLIHVRTRVNGFGYKWDHRFVDCQWNNDYQL